MRRPGRPCTPAGNSCSSQRASSSCASAARSSSLQGRCCASSQISIGAERGTPLSVSAKLTLWWRSAIDRQIDADQLRHLLLHRAGGEHDMRRLERSGARPRARPEPRGRVRRASMPTTLPRSSFTPRSRAASSITMPSCCALSQPARRACATATVSGARYGKVPADQARIGDDVRAGEREIEAALGRGRVGARRRVVKPRRPAAARLGHLRHRLQETESWPHRRSRTHSRGD